MELLFWVIYFSFLGGRVVHPKFIITFALRNGGDALYCIRALTERWFVSQVVRHRSAKPSTAVRFRHEPH